MGIDYSKLGSPETRSFWLNQFGPYSPILPLIEDHRTDIVIIGGGFTGLSCAAHLKELEPSLDVTVLEGSAVGFGASGRNGGFSMTLFGFEPEITCLLHGKEKARAAHQYMQDAVDYVRECVTRYNFDSDYEHNGFLRIALTSKHRERLQKQQDLYRELGFSSSFDWWGEDQLSQRLHSPLAKAGLFEQRCGILNPAKHVRHWKAICEQLGVHIYENTQCQAITYPRDGVTVQTSGGTVTASKVVLATNAYSHLLPEMGAFRRNQTPVWTHQIVTQPLTPEQWQAIGWAGRYGIETNRHLVHYLRPTADGRITFGGANVVTTAGQNMSLDHHKPTWRTLEKHLKTLFPPLAEIGIDYQWGGPVSVTLDMVPNLGFYKDDRTLYLCGCTGHGVSLTQYSGKTLAELALGRESKRTQAWFVNRKPVRWPVQPFKQLGIGAVKGALKAEDYWWERKLW